MIILHHKLFDVDEIPLTLLTVGKKIKVAAKKHLPAGALKIPLFFKHHYSMVMEKDKKELTSPHAVAVKGHLEWRSGDCFRLPGDEDPLETKFREIREGRLSLER